MSVRNGVGVAGRSMETRADDRASHTPSVSDKAPFWLDNYQMSWSRRARRWMRDIKTPVHLAV